MRRIGWLVVLVAVAALLAGCGGGKKEVREGPVTVAGGEGGRPAPGDGGAGIRIAVVTHGQASSPFWAIVRNGVEAASRQMGSLVSYRAPDVYSLRRMTELVDQAVASRPDGLVVSLPERGLAPAVRRAVKAHIPVVTINSGSDFSKSLGVLAHVGQPEDRAGLGAGRRLAEAGARRVICANHQVGNQGLDARCAGLSRAMRQVGGHSQVLSIDDMSPSTPRRISTAIADERADAVLTLNSTAGEEAVEAVRLARARGRVKVATFDLGPDVLRDVKDGKIAFAVDQQAYLQGYLPVVLLTQYARYGLFPDQGGIIATGPNFVTRVNADKAIGLVERSIR